MNALLITVGIIAIVVAFVGVFMLVRIANSNPDDSKGD